MRSNVDDFRDTYVGEPDVPSRLCRRSVHFVLGGDEDMRQVIGRLHPRGDYLGHGVTENLADGGYQALY